MSVSAHSVQRVTSQSTTPFCIGTVSVSTLTIWPETNSSATWNIQQHWAKFHTHFWIRNWSHIGTHLVVLLVVVGQKSDSVNRCVTLLEEQSCQISSRSDLKRWALSHVHTGDYSRRFRQCGQGFRFFEERRPNKKNKNNKMSSNMGSVPDLKMLHGHKGRQTEKNAQKNKYFVKYQLQ